MTPTPTFAFALAALLVAAPAMSQTISRTVDLVGEGGRSVGTVTLTEAPRGILVRIEATGLRPGWHGMHFHSVATCADPGFKASGGHVHGIGVATPVHGLLNPAETDLGDLPNLNAAADGTAKAEVFAPNLSLGNGTDRLNLIDADGSALVIHAAPDDHQSQPIGGAGARVACAAIK